MNNLNEIRIRSVQSGNVVSLMRGCVINSFEEIIFACMGLGLVEVETEKYNLLLKDTKS